MGSLPGPVFFALAHRLSAYRGVMALRAAEQEAETAPDVPGPPPGRAEAPEQVTPKAVLQNDAAFAGIFSFGEMAAG
jgi:hypothetical protein